MADDPRQDDTADSETEVAPSLVTNSVAQFSTMVSYAVYYYISDHLGTGQLLVNDQGAVVWQGNYTRSAGWMWW